MERQAPQAPQAPPAPPSPPPVVTVRQVSTRVCVPATAADCMHTDRSAFLSYFLPFSGGVALCLRADRDRHPLA